MILASCFLSWTLSSVDKSICSPLSANGPNFLWDSDSIVLLTDDGFPTEILPKRVFCLWAQSGPRVVTLPKVAPLQSDLTNVNTVQYCSPFKMGHFRAKTGATKTGLDCISTANSFAFTTPYSSTAYEKIFLKIVHYCVPTYVNELFLKTRFKNCQPSLCK